MNTTIRTRTEIEALAAVVKIEMGANPALGEAMLEDLRTQWRNAPVAHSCEDFDGECYVEGVDAEGNETFGCPHKAARTALLVTETVAQVIATPAPVAVADIPASKYALANAGGKLAFFEVQIGKGKWAGLRFVKALVGAPGDWNRLPMNVAAQKNVLAQIATDTYRDGMVELTGPRAAAVRFSREYVCCAACGSPLSDEDSIARGLGPICQQRF